MAIKHTGTLSRVSPKSIIELTLLMAFLLLGGIAISAMTLSHAVAPSERLDDENWKTRHEAKLVEARARPIGLVLLGDSITANYELIGPEQSRDYSRVWQQYYADRNALNLGFSGDGTRHLLWRITHGEIDGVAPKVAIVLIGTNDIGYLSLSPEDTIAGIEAVLAELHLRLPTTKILLVGLLPSNRGARYKPRRPKLTPHWPSVTDKAGHPS